MIGEELQQGAETSAGYFSPEARDAAARGALPLVASYFVSGQTQLRRAAIFTSAPETDRGLDKGIAGVRLRVALAMGRELEDILQGVVARPNFRYQLSKGESVGAVVGQLDVNEYALSRGLLTEAAVFPVLNVERGQVTPENRLATFAVSWLVREVREAARIARVPAGSPEKREAIRLSLAMNRLMVLPLFSACRASVSSIRRSGDLQALTRTVGSRLRRGEVASPDAYRRLVDWTKCFAEGTLPEEGNRDWLHYGSSFDTRLFELWCANLTAECIADALFLAKPEVRAGWSQDGIMFTWDRPGGRLELVFQRSVQTITNGERRPRWKRRTGGTRDLGGVPDLVAKATSPSGEVRLAIIDPKLRQRETVPTEELYKILGYFENYELSAQALGAVTYYAPSTQDPVVDTYDTHDNGKLFAIPLDPLRPEAGKQTMQPLVDCILEQIGYVSPQPKNREQRLTKEDSPFEAVILSRLQELRCVEVTLGPGLDASKARVEMALGERRWAALNSSTQNMLATSEHVGFTLGQTADYSSAVVGLCAALEVVMYDALATPVLERFPDVNNGRHIMLGTLIDGVEQGLEGKGTQLAKAIGMHIHETGPSRAELGRLVPYWWDVNRDFRIPAAHRETMSIHQWRKAWRTLVGHGQVLGATIDVLLLATNSSEDSE
ncbi:hypothetical protein [Pseudarthrobacter sp. WHRI 8279]|uniref:hypothetical protein n=1 Tax=Pseudarthrobacter sp. WHRI 8279 TaxID=3162566 RepID=UPI0032EDCB10